MSVDPQRHMGGGMAQALGCQGHIHPSSQHQAGRGVAQVVDADGGEVEVGVVLADASG